jgi:L-alanine-DL-glutamate epimerase-like enolase superfamily enzyme
MKVAAIEFIHLDVPFEAHTDTQMKYWLPHWRISQLCKVTLDNGVVGWGETIPNYTWSKVPDGVEERVLDPDGRHRYHDELGCPLGRSLPPGSLAGYHLHEYL